METWDASRAKVLVAIPFGFILHTMRLSAGIVLALWFGHQLLSNLASQPGEGGVALRAHIGGFLAGMPLVLIFKKRISGCLRRLVEVVFLAGNGTRGREFASDRGHIPSGGHMRLGGRRASTNVEDRRGMRVGRAGGIGLGTVVLALIAAYFGVDPGVVLQNAQQSAPLQQEQVPYQESATEAQARELVTLVLGDTEDTWGQIFASAGRTYEQPTLVLFSEAVQSACGVAQSASGPFYCPGDHKLYIDLTFYQELQQRFGAPGDFAQAYVIAHEVGHHVQTLLGISERNHAARARAREAEANALSVRQELQADCFAGLWAHNAERSRPFLESGDIEEGLNAAAAIGDDRLTKGRAPPEAFTHGTSEQRVRWFKRGLQTGSVNDCDTFATRDL